MTSTRSPSIIAARTQTILLGSALYPFGHLAFAQAQAERLSDKSVKALVDAVDEGRDAFEGNLDGKSSWSRRSRGPGGQTKVAVALQIYEDSTKRLKDRFGPGLLRQRRGDHRSQTVDGHHVTFMQASPDLHEGPRLSGILQRMNLQRLAEGYGTTFPLPDGATPRRTNDKEIVAVTTAIADCR